MSVRMDLEGHGKPQLGDEPDRYNEKCGVFGCFNVVKASHTVIRGDCEDGQLAGLFARDEGADT